MEESTEIESPGIIPPIDDLLTDDNKDPDVGIAIEGLKALEGLIENDDFDGVLLCLTDVYYNLRLDSCLPLYFGKDYGFIEKLFIIISYDDLCTQFLALSTIGKLIQLSPILFHQFLNNDGIEKIIPFIYRREISYFKPSISIVIALTMRDECHDVINESTLLPNVVNKLNKKFGKLEAMMVNQSHSISLIRQRIHLLLKVVYNIISIMDNEEQEPHLECIMNLFIEIINSPFGFDYFPIVCDSIRIMTFPSNVKYIVDRIGECYEGLTACFQKSLNMKNIKDMSIYMRTIIQILNKSNQQVPNEFLDVIPLNLTDEIIHTISNKATSKGLEMSVAISFLEASLLSNDGYLLNQYFSEEMMLSLAFIYNESPGSSKDFALNFLWALAKLLPPDGLKKLFESKLFEPMLTIFDSDDESFLNHTVQQTIVTVLNHYKQIDENPSSGTWCSIRISLENALESDEIGYSCDLIRRLVFGSEDVDM